MGLRPLNGAPDATRPGAEATGLAAARRRAGGRPTGVILPGVGVALAAAAGRWRSLHRADEAARPRHVAEAHGSPRWVAG